MNLTHSTDSTFTLRGDSFSVVPASSRGRKSVRLASKNTYTAVSALDMPLVQIWGNAS